MCISVDLPEPDGPMTAVSAPGATSTETPRSASTAVSPSPYRRVRSLATTTGCSVSTLLSHVRLLVGSAPTLPDRVTPAPCG